MKKARRQETLRPIATKLLANCKAKQIPVPLEKVAECLGVEIRLSPADDDISGMLIESRGTAIIGVNSNHHRNRQRFTIAHELAHFVLGHGNEHIDEGFSLQMRDSRASMAVHVNEIEANRFAAELLIPYDMIIKDLKNLPVDLEDDKRITDLAKKYEVSVQAMTIRISNIFEF